MAILEVVLAGVYFNQQTISRWNYVSTGTPAAVSLSFALASAFGAIYDEVAIPPGYPADTPLALISELCNAGWTWEQLTVLDPYSPTDFYQTPFVNPYGGVGEGTGMSPMNAYGFRTNQVRRDVARGTKRFPGTEEESVDAGGVIGSALMSLMNDVADKMTETLTYDDEGNTLSFAPAICGKEEYDPNPPPLTGNHRAYKYYGTLAEQLEHTAIGVLWQPYTTIRSQTSRQYGHGR
jgi:hypothetical protein